MIEGMLQEGIARALYNDWRTSDRELTVEWDDAPDSLRRVFLRYAEVAYNALFGEPGDGDGDGQA